MKIVWYARGGGIAKAGPFATQIQATNSLRQVTETDREYQYATRNGVHRPRLCGGFPADAFVWPEEINE